MTFSTVFHELAAILVIAGVGAFLGGVSIASTVYREAIASRLTGLRDFLLLFFFIDLDSGLNLSATGLQLAPAIVLSLFVLVEIR